MVELGADDARVAWSRVSDAARERVPFPCLSILNIPWGRVTLPQITRILVPRISFWARET